MALEIKIASSSEQWLEEEWQEWDKMLAQNPSAYLGSRSIKAALDVDQRFLQAVKWVDESGEIVGIAQIEDTLSLIHI